MLLVWNNKYQELRYILVDLGRYVQYVAGSTRALEHYYKHQSDLIRHLDHPDRPLMYHQSSNCYRV